MVLNNQVEEHFRDTADEVTVYILLRSSAHGHVDTEKPVVFISRVLFWSRVNHQCTSSPTKKYKNQNLVGFLVFSKNIKYSPFV